MGEGMTAMVTAIRGNVRFGPLVVALLCGLCFLPNHGSADAFAVGPPFMIWNPFKQAVASKADEEQVQRPSRPVIRIIQPGDVIWTPGNSSTTQHDFDFRPFGDREMGGISHCVFNNTDGTWKGQVQKDHTGGLIGVRSTPDVCYNCFNCEGFAIKAKVAKVGGGTAAGRELTLKFKCRNSKDPLDGLTFTTLIDANVGEESVWKVPFKSQTPTQWSRVLPGEEFNKNIVSGFKFVYSKIKYNDEVCPHFELGDFEMQLLEIVAY